MCSRSSHLRSAERTLRKMSRAASAFPSPSADRNLESLRPMAARYGLTVADVQSVITSEIGGADIAQNVEGRERFPIAVRYQRGFRDHPEALSQALIPTPSGEQIPISQVARVFYSRGPAMIRDEDGSLTGYVYLNLNTHDYGGFVNHAEKLINQKLELPAGYTRSEEPRA